MIDRTRTLGLPFALALILSLQPAPLSAEEACAARPLALTFSKDFLNARLMLSRMVIDVASRSQPFQMATISAQREGRAQEIMPQVQSRLEATVDRHVAQWACNLALAYQDHYTDEEMQSMLDKPETSPHLPKLQQTGEAVGETMRELSSPILGAAATELSNGMWAEFGKKKETE